MTHAHPSAADRRWLTATWPFVREHLPPPPCRVLDVGCGPVGGFVPPLRAEGYDAEGVDPEAPDGPFYHRVQFERYDARQSAAAVVASNSLHHVSDVEAVVELITRRLDAGGVLVVAEWAHERFDEATARWCFDRLAADVPGWLHRRRDEWLASGQSWDAYLDGHAHAERMHTGQDILRSLSARFDTRLSPTARTSFPT